MQRIKKITAIILSVLTLSSVCVFGSSFSAGAKGTGAGLAEWALNAYNSGWSYVYGGSTPGAVDCSGLIYSYAGGERCGNPQLETATETGSVSAGIPNVHGLGLWRPGHVGVYVGNGMEVDARGDEYGVCYEAIGGYNNWTYWFKLAAVSYVTNGWESFNGNYYYYENGEYIVNTSRTIDGTTYYFDSQGRSSKTPSNTSSSSSSGSGSSGSSGSSSHRVLRYRRFSKDLLTSAIMTVQLTVTSVTQQKRLIRHSRKPQVLQLTVLQAIREIHFIRRMLPKLQKPIQQQRLRRSPKKKQLLPQRRQQSL